MAGGQPAEFEAALPLLRELGANVTRLGETGAGQAAKMLNPAIVGAGCGREHTVAFTAAGQAYGWGQDTYGQLGDRAGTAQRSPVQVPGVTGVRKAHGGFGFTILRVSA